MYALSHYLTQLIDKDGSDLHIKASSTVRIRVNGEIAVLDENIVTKEEVAVFVKTLLGERFDEFVRQKELDMVYRFNEHHRFRINMFFQIEGISCVFRTIPVKIPSISALGLPKALKTFAALERGLVLATGVTGSGKSTTLAALLDEINTHAKKHIITIEDPVEFVHKDKSCIINQRNIGQDTLGFAQALRAALREDPDVIFVGEMRDAQTIETALHAAETGHLVFSTLHTLDAKETLNRIIATFPVSEQNRIRVTLASVLKGVISQRLVPTVKNSRAAALEIMVTTARIEQMIRDNRDSEILDAIAEGKGIYGSQSFDQALFDLVENNTVSVENALAYATSPSDLKLKFEHIRSEHNGTQQEGLISLKN